MNAVAPQVAPKPTIKKLSWWHEAIIDWMLLHPEGRLGDCAREFRCTQSWLSIIVNSDVFQMRLAARRAELASEVGATVRDRLGGIAGQSLEAIAERLETEKAKIPIGELRETADMALSALGYGSKRGAGGGTGDTYNFLNVNHVSRDVLANAREKMQHAQLQLVRSSPAPRVEVLPPVQERRDDDDYSLPAAAPVPASG